MPKHSTPAKSLAAAPCRVVRAPRVVVAAPRVVCALLALLCCCAAASAQKSEAPASITGRITDGEHGVAGIIVTLTLNDPTQRFKTVARAKTDAEGRYSLSGIAPGRYQLAPYAPVYVVQGTNNWPPGRALTLMSGDEVSNMDFSVERGGVITGRVTDGDGNPVIAEFVSIMPADKTTQMPRRLPSDSRDQMTDDRGIYRIYGLPAGSYHVGVGQASDTMGAVTFGRRKIFRRTFYPDATDEAQARTVEVKSGFEATDIDITLGRPLKTYKASGRFVNAETGLPVPNVVFGYGTLDPSGRRVASFGGGMATNVSGEFQTEGLAPGRYMVFAYPQNNSEFYSDPVNFEVADADVSGVTVKLKRGASVTGTVIIEGVSDPAVAARMLGKVRLYTFVDSSSSRVGVPTNYSLPPIVAPDGTFRIAGMHPGKLRIGAGSEGEPGLTFSRIELNGAPVTGGIDVTEGAQVSGLRVVMAYGNGVIRGQTSFINGTPPPQARLMVTARRVSPGEEPRGNSGVSAQADVRGSFRLEGLRAGEYEVTLRVFNDGQVFQSVAQRVSLMEGGEMSVALVIDLGAPLGARGGRR